ncbi:MAG TPA: zf-HC2 domain-containing protein [Pyrinomonadaceae bacterium]|nr:zf-HC2 domain-containing protein [Pyrinomonadaceae bacterium]
MSNSNHTCQTDNIAAYIDGDLEPALRSALEDHLKQCAPCAAELRDQRLFMCELDSALAGPFDLAVPPNFARVVAVHAESDMRGARDVAERKRALRFCIILGLAAFALLGFASSKAVLLNLRSVVSKVFGVLSFFAQTVFDAAAGLILLSRVVSRGLIADSRIAGVIGFVFVVLAVGVLSLLISRYHRTRLTE